MISLVDEGEESSGVTEGSAWVWEERKGRKRTAEGGEPEGAIGQELEEFGGQGGHLEEKGPRARERWEKREEGGRGGGVSGG
jgi:hypothetical protein